MEPLTLDTKWLGDRYCGRIVALDPSGWDTFLWPGHCSNKNLIKAFTRSTSVPFEKLRLSRLRWEVLEWRRTPEQDVYFQATCVAVAGTLVAGLHTVPHQSSLYNFHPLLFLKEAHCLLCTLRTVICSLDYCRIHSDSSPSLPISATTAPLPHTPKSISTLCLDPSLPCHARTLP